MEKKPRARKKQVTAKAVKKRKRKQPTNRKSVSINEKRKQRIHSKTDVFSWITLLLFAIICIWFLLSFVSHRVDGVSMLPSLENNQRVLVKKNTLPNRYDIVTFAPKGKPEESYIKRVIGMPGDAIWLDGERLFINHQLEDGTMLEDWSGTSQQPDGTIVIAITSDVYNELYGLTNIPDKSYFVLGDNRNNSTDSRRFGLVREEQIEGVALYRYYPFNKVGPIS